jgi:hypothetical protein
MPSWVRRHRSHSRTGRPEIVRGHYATVHHSRRWSMLVAELRHRGGVRNPEAVATSVLGRDSFVGRSRRNAR